jgi:hypothetical protein
MSAHRLLAEVCSARGEKEPITEKNKVAPWKRVNSHRINETTSRRKNAP